MLSFSNDTTPIIVKESADGLIVTACVNLSASSFHGFFRLLGQEEECEINLPADVERSGPPCPAAVAKDR
jgi:hypothetical protein